jgi:sugar phosphate isomerase/epimerase
MNNDQPTLVYWAGNSISHPILKRAEGAAEAGYKVISCVAGDLVELDREGTPLSTVRRRLDELGLELNTIDPYLGWYPGYDPTVGVAVEYGGDHLAATEADILRWAEELGATYVSTLAPFDDPSGRHQNPARASREEMVEALGNFADAAAKVGLRPHLEPIPTTHIGDLATALELVEAVDRPNLGLLIDTYNLARSGDRPEDLDPVPHELVFQLQLADAAAEAVGENYFDDAVTRRFAGDGELDAAAMVERLLAKGPLPPTGAETINYEWLDKLEPAEAAALSIESTRRFLAGLGA